MADSPGCCYETIENLAAPLSLKVWCIKVLQQLACRTFSSLCYKQPPTPTGTKGYKKSGSAVESGSSVSWGQKPQQQDKLLLTAAPRFQQGFDADFKEAGVLLAGHGCSLPSGVPLPAPHPPHFTWGIPPAVAAAAAAGLGQAGSLLLSPLCDAHSAVLTNPWENTVALLYSSSCVLSLAISPLSLPPFPLSLSLSKAVAGSGRQRKLLLNNCAEAESAGSNPLSRARLIITTVCLRAGHDNDVIAGPLRISAWLGASDRPLPLAEEMENEGSTWHIAGNICESGGEGKRHASDQRADRINCTQGGRGWLLTFNLPWAQQL